VGGRVTCKAWLSPSALGYIGPLLAISASASSCSTVIGEVRP
jgi:hypothetical protein